MHNSLGKIKQKPKIKKPERSTLWNHARSQLGFWILSSVLICAVFIAEKYDALIDKLDKIKNVTNEYGNKYGFKYK